MKFKLVLTLLSLAGLLAQAADKAAPDILAGLRPEHPRLLITAAMWNGLRAHKTNTSTTATIIAQTEAGARELLNESPVDYHKEGRRLLAVSREALRRITLLSFAWRMTGEKVFLDRAEQELLTVAAFKDWNPSHFLDTAEMTAAVAIGYDWLFEKLSPATRATLRQAILEKGLQPGMTGRNWWQTATMNWNQVCFGGLTLGALAIADEKPKEASEFLTLTRANNPHGLEPYAPDGIYPEGPGYWNYGTSYQVLLLAALETALGTDWNLAARPGFLASAATLLQLTGPTGRPFNFSDGHDSVSFNPTLFWFAQKLHRPELVYAQNNLLRQRLAKGSDEADWYFPLLAIWTRGLPPEIPAPAWPLAWHGDGPNPVGVFRSSWMDANALFLAFKGGSARLNHAHMDAGSFVLDADGVRWACDLGAQSYYSVEQHGWALFSMKQDSDRWRVYRLNNFSHNTLTLGGKLHNMKSDARITAFTTNSATVDLSQIFAGQAGSVIRHFNVGDNRRVVIRDDIAKAKPGLSVRWQMLTHASISTNRNEATFRQAGKTLSAKILSPANALFEIASAQPPDDGVNQRNPNTQILTVNTAVPTGGNLTVEIQLQPVPAAGK
ncbi:MAG: heparinase II/III family protein [Verrucomicrobiota bacterium]